MFALLGISLFSLSSFFSFLLQEAGGANRKRKTSNPNFLILGLHKNGFEMFVFLGRTKAFLKRNEFVKTILASSFTRNEDYCSGEGLGSCGKFV